jgi:hypothetical protein
MARRTKGMQTPIVALAPVDSLLDGDGDGIGVAVEVLEALDVVED